MTSLVGAGFHHREPAPSVEVDPHSLFRSNVGDLLAAGMRLTPAQLRLLDEPSPDDFVLGIWIPPDPGHWRVGCCESFLDAYTGDVDEHGQPIYTKVRLPVPMQVDWRLQLDEDGEVELGDQATAMPSVFGWIETPIEGTYMGGEAIRSFVRLWNCVPITAEQATVFDAATERAFTSSNWDFADTLCSLFEDCYGETFEEALKEVGFPEVAPYEELRPYYENETVPEVKISLELEGEELDIWNTLLRAGPRNQRVAEQILKNQARSYDYYFERSTSPWD